MTAATKEIGKINRIGIGIPEVNKLIEGGIPECSIVLLAGEPGTGKTIFGLHYISAGVKEGEKCAYVAIEQNPEELKIQAKILGKDVGPAEFISAKDIKYDLGLGKKPEDVIEKIKLVLEKLQKLKVKRVVIDSVSSLQLEDGIKARLVVKMLVDGLKKLGATAVITGESLNGIYPDEVTPFLVDGMIVLKRTHIGNETRRVLEVIKMRLTDCNDSPQQFEITKKGIKIIAGE